jgi:ABC-type antimicrobial peptide transport system permease subunit
MTLGATPAAVRGMVLRRGAALALLGTVLGVPAALAATRVLATGVAGLPGLDGVSLAGAAALMAGAALAACYVPARRATRVDPASTLRAQ